MARYSDRDDWGNPAFEQSFTDTPSHEHIYHEHPPRAHHHVHPPQVDLTPGSPPTPWPGPDSQAHAVSGWTTPPKSPVWPWFVLAIVAGLCAVGMYFVSTGDKPSGVGGQIVIPTTIEPPTRTGGPTITAKPS